MEMKGIASLKKDESGQATVELMLTLPVIIAVAAIAINALSFFGVTASFDCLFPQVVRVCAQAPGYDDAAYSTASQIQAKLEDRFSSSGCAVQVDVAADSSGNQLFTGEVRYEPTLFGFSLRSSIFGMDFSPLTHKRSVAISPYRPGVLL